MKAGRVLDTMYYLALNTNTVVTPCFAWHSMHSMFSTTLTSMFLFPLIEAC